MRFLFHKRFHWRVGARGFTLIELMIAMSITSLLAVIAIMGQSALQSRARFDSAVDKTIQNIAYARNYATSNVNTQGGGNDATSLVVGTSLEFDNRHYFANRPLEEMAPVYAIPDAQGYPDLNNLLEVPADIAANPSLCPASQHPDDNDECFEDFFQLATPLIFLDPNAPGFSLNYSSPNVAIGILYFVNTGSGVMICHQTDTMQVDSGHACATSRNTPFDFVVLGPDGQHATIEVDPSSGFAKRLN